MPYSNIMWCYVCNIIHCKRWINDNWKIGKENISTAWKHFHILLVLDTVRKGIIDINSFNGSEELAMAGSFSALTGTSVWLLIATFFNLPVSGTHSIVGATIGYGLVAIGPDGITWEAFGKIGNAYKFFSIFILQNDIF